MICDNASGDDTSLVVDEFNRKYPIRYIQNETNVGSDLNFANCYNLSSGKFFLLIGDDDVFVKGAFLRLIAIIKQFSGQNLGGIYMPAAAYVNELNETHPQNTCSKIFVNSEEFLRLTAHRVTFISSFVINKEIVGSVDAKDFVGQCLVQLHWLFRVLTNGDNHLILRDVMLSCSKSSSANFDYGRVFVGYQYSIIDQYFGAGSSIAINMKCRILPLLIAPLMVRQKLYGNFNRDLVLSQIRVLLHGQSARVKTSFHLFCLPVAYLPNALAYLYGLGISFLYRLFLGEIWILRKAQREVIRSIKGMGSQNVR